MKKETKSAQISELREELKAKKEQCNQYKKKISYYENEWGEHYSFKEKLKERDRLHKEMISINENERWQTVQYLHDEIGQPMVAVDLRVQTLLYRIQREDSVDEIIDDIRQVIQMVRQVSKNVLELSHDVIPIDVEGGDIANAFKKLARNAEKLYGFVCTFKMPIAEDVIKNTYVATHLHRIAQEAVKNAGIHSRATKVNMNLTSTDNDLVLLIEDDGIGYRQQEKESGKGVKLMKCRADHMNGMLSINNRNEEGGTVVRCTMPMERVIEKESFRNNRVRI